MNSGGIINSNGLGYNNYELHKPGYIEWRKQDMIKLYVGSDRYCLSVEIPLRCISRPSQPYSYYTRGSGFFKDKDTSCYCLKMAIEVEEAKKNNIYPFNKSTKIFYPENGKPYSFFEFRFDKLESAKATKKIIEQQRIEIFDTLEQKIVKTSSISSSSSEEKK
jgi:hypothetical protein